MGDGGGGAGGSVFIQCNILRGAGRVQAIGGRSLAGTSGGGGAGGRVALDHISSSYTGQLLVYGGMTGMCTIFICTLKISSSPPS